MILRNEAFHIFLDFSLQKLSTLDFFFEGLDFLSFGSKFLILGVKKSFNLCNLRLNENKYLRERFPKLKLLIKKCLILSFQILFQHTQNVLLKFLPFHASCYFLNVQAAFQKLIELVPNNISNHKLNVPNCDIISEMSFSFLHRFFDSHFHILHMLILLVKFSLA